MYQFPPVTDRVARLRAEYRDTTPYIDSERTRIVTEFYKANPNEVDIIKRAKTLYNILTQCTIRIEPDELIVGNTGKYNRNCMIFAEYNGIDWIKRELETGVFDTRNSQEGACIMPQEDREYFLSVADFWHVNCVGGVTTTYMPPEYEAIGMTGTLTHGPWSRNQTHGHYNTNIRKAVDKGFGAIKKEAQEKLAEMSGKIGTDKAEKFFFYSAVVICCDAAIAYSKRFAAEARRLCEIETSEKRKAELLKIAECMDWIMENPARNFYEAVQACYLYTLILCIEGAFLGLTIGRFDQHVGDYLERELAEGTITEDEAQEIVDCYCLKVGNLIGGGAKEFMTAAGAYSNNMRLTLGGRKKDGTDATNHVTYMTLNTMARLRLHDPNTSLCVHDETPLSLWEVGMGTNERCGGKPTIEGTDLMIKIMQKRGLEIEDARNFCLIGCVELSGSGCDWCNVSGPFSKAFMTFPGVVLLAINDGKNPKNGVQGGLKTGYLYEMETFEDVKKAFSDQLEYIMNWHLTFDTLIEYIGNPKVPLPIASATMDGCMESGRDMMTGGAKYNSTGTAAIGIGTTIDSLVAIKYAVFDKKFCTARELYDAVMANWEGYEDLRMRIQNETPFFGNGNEYSD
ncbi:MAG: pyruvate formate lyase family protein, partial [Oscillospiraceae bacterium]|nr:pyruvate formate lyase family protein [Oscillospiraceae bacterium]